MEKENTIEKPRVAKKLAMLAQLKNFTQQQVANKTGVSRVSINRFFKGKSELRAKDLCSLLNVLGIDLEEIVDEQIICRSKSAPTDLPTSQLHEIPRILGNLDDSVRKTLLDQIYWWDKLKTSSHSSQILINKVV